MRAPVRSWHVLFSKHLTWMRLIGIVGLASTAGLLPLGGCLSLEKAQAPLEAGSDSTFTHDFSFAEMDNSEIGIDHVGGAQILNGVLQVTNTPANQTDSASSFENTGVGFPNGTPESNIAVASTGIQLVISQTPDLDASWTPAWSSLKGYWKLNGTVGAVAVSGTAFTGVTGGTGVAAGSGIQLTAGQVHSGAYFSDANSRIDLPNSFTVSSTGPLTVMFWNKVDLADLEASTVGSAFTLGNATPDGASAQVPALDKILYWSFMGGQVAADYSDLLDAWTHVALTANPATQDLKIYLNGALRGHCTGVACGMNGHAVTLTAGAIGGFPGVSQYHVGLLDDFAVFNQELSATQLKTVYARQATRGQYLSRPFDSGVTSAIWNGITWKSSLPFGKPINDIGQETVSSYSGILNSAGLSGPSDLRNGLIHLWHLDEAAGATTLLDQGAFKKNLSLLGSPVVGAPGVLSRGVGFTGVSGASGQAAYFNTFAAPLRFTYAAWVYVHSSSGTPYLIANTSNPSEGFSLRLNGGFAQATVTSASGVSTSVTSTVALPLKTWTHLVARYEGTNLAVFQNGAFVKSVAVPAPRRDYTCLSIGSLLNSGCTATDNTSLKGVISEVAVWNRGIKAHEIEQLYRRGANRIQVLMRTCNTCTNETWIARSLSYPMGYTEAGNTTNNHFGSGAATPVLPTSPLIGFAYGVSHPAAKAQYLVTLESLSRAFAPNLQSISYLPSHYPTITVRAFTQEGIPFTSLSSLSITLGPKGCTEVPKFELSQNKTKWWSYANRLWSESTSYGTANLAAEFTPEALAAFGGQVGAGKFHIRIYLPSDGSSPCEIKKIHVTGTQ